MDHRYSHERSADIPSENQGAFFGAELVGEEVRIVVPENGVYYPTDTPQRASKSIEVIEERNRQEKVATQLARFAQAGRHSALEYGETYSEGVRPGVVLPGNHVVTDKNYRDACGRAELLDRRRRRYEYNNPQLPEDTTNITEQQKDIPLLDSVTKLDILQSSEKTGFLPATNDEKNAAIDLLSITERDPSHGVHVYIMETYDHLAKELISSHISRAEAYRRTQAGTISRIHEFGDYYKSAQQNEKVLTWLNDIIARTANPHISLYEALQDNDAEDSDFAFLSIVGIVRYDDLNSFDHGEKLPFYAMTEREDREITEDGKNKQAYDPYMAAFLVEEKSTYAINQAALIRKHVLHRMNEMKVGELRGIIPKATHNERRRGQFWERILRGMEGSYKAIAEQYIGSEDSLTR